MTAVGSAVLMGEDHHDYGRIASASAGERYAVAISRGAVPKRYSYVDPNEDAAAVFAGDEGAVLMVVDGHNGYTSTRVASEMLASRFGPSPPTELMSREAVVDLFTEVSRAILAETTAAGASHPDSRAAMSLVILAGTEMQWASMGDAPIYFARSESATELTKPEHRFVGWSPSRDNTEDSLQLGRRPVDGAGDSWVVLTSDGFSDYAGGPAADAAMVLHSAVGGAPSAEAAAERVLLSALSGDAADNVAAVVASL